MKSRNDSGDSEVGINFCLESKDKDMLKLDTWDAGRLCQPDYAINAFQITVFHNVELN